MGQICRKSCVFTNSSVFCTLAIFLFFCVKSEPKLSILKLIWTQFVKKAVFSLTVQFLVQWSTLIFFVNSETYLSPIFRKSCVFTDSSVFCTLAIFDFFCVNSTPKLSILKFIGAQLVEKAEFTDSLVLVQSVVNFDFFVSILNLNCQFWNIFEPDLSKKLYSHWQFSFSTVVNFEFLCQFWT